MLAPVIGKFVFRPDATYASADTTPTDLNLDYEDLTLVTADGVRLSAWFMPANAPKGALLYLHGNSGNLCDWIHAVDRYVWAGYHVLLVDYRGYGRSEGKPTEKGLYLDTEAAWDWISKRAAAERLDTFVLGKSLGSGVATHLAAHVASARSPMAGLILDSPFTSMREVVALHAKPLPRLLVPKMFESLAKFPGISAPTLILHGDDDTLIPVSHGLRLFEKLNSPKALGVIPGARHNDITSFPIYEFLIRSFLKDPHDMIRNYRDVSEATVQAYAGR